RRRAGVQRCGSPRGWAGDMLGPTARSGAGSHSREARYADRGTPGGQEQREPGGAGRCRRPRAHRARTRRRGRGGAGVGSRVSDEDYRAAGATVLDSADEVWARAEMIIKVKEPLPEEYGHLRKGLILFTYLHLAADAQLAEALLSSGTTSIAYETVQRPDRSLPLLAPMSTIAGRLAAQVGAYHLMAPLGGAGVLMGGVPGTAEANVLVVGGGVVGEQAAMMAHGLHANVTVMDLD